MRNPFRNGAKTMFLGFKSLGEGFAALGDGMASLVYPQQRRMARSIMQPQFEIPAQVSEEDLRKIGDDMRRAMFKLTLEEKVKLNASWDRETKINTYNDIASALNEREKLQLREALEL